MRNPEIHREIKGEFIAHCESYNANVALISPRVVVLKVWPSISCVSITWELAAGPRPIHFKMLEVRPSNLCLTSPLDDCKLFSSHRTIASVKVLYCVFYSKTALSALGKTNSLKCVIGKNQKGIF